ncbi:uracil-DNA glycosylase [Spiroplasma litorale]|uniref:Uracil-DNA glycosylase n=1 Tax=Spiroplasma litorale TaxID=216942 RepID=A0A0K1W059_9MOLU|nr:uracil-DNA glycosylase [Spiroplasma litorale]AKX33695.1 uracil-DNA glycosylase [Spiroplasma litorale]
MEWENLLSVEWLKLIKSSNLDDKLSNIWNKLKQKSNFTPPLETIFRLFQNIEPHQIKVIIIGQDPYHGEGQADGIAFSSFNNLKTPRSLSNIFKELSNDLNIDHSKNNNLIGWVKQGVFLINTSLTVKLHKPNSHKDIGWNEFIIELLENINKINSNIIYCLWGNCAKSIYNKFKKKVEDVIETTHPSPFSFNRGFSGSKIFSKINEKLLKKGLNAIDWRL